MHWKKNIKLLYDNEGFTILEILVVMVVMGILIGIGAEAASSIRQTNALNTANSQFRNLANDLRQRAIEQQTDYNNVRTNIDSPWIYGEVMELVGNSYTLWELVKDINGGSCNDGNPPATNYNYLPPSPNLGGLTDISAASACSSYVPLNVNELGDSSGNSNEFSSSIVNTNIINIPDGFDMQIGWSPTGNLVVFAPPPFYILFESGTGNIYFYNSQGQLISKANNPGQYADSVRIQIANGAPASSPVYQINIGDLFDGNTIE